jgi:hypothetical protein
MSTTGGKETGAFFLVSGAFTFGEGGSALEACWTLGAGSFFALALAGCCWDAD